MPCPTRSLFLCLIAMTIHAAASAQGDAVSVVECEGTATLYAAPSYADFVFETQIEGASFEAAMTSALSFSGRIRDALAARDLPLISVEPVSPAIPDLPDNLVVVSTTARLGLAGLGGGDAADIEFARVCDAVAAVAAAMECAVAGPILVLGDREALIRSAVAAATENAYPVCDALAVTLKSAVYAVESVRVKSLEWNLPGDDGSFRPTIHRVACTATIAVSYAIGAAI